MSSPSRIPAFILLIVGAALLPAAIFVDSLGFSGGGEGVGWKQLIAAIAGLIVFLLGLAWLIRPESDDSPPGGSSIVGQR